MAKSTDKTPQPQTWIVPSFAWTVEPEVFLVNVPASDPDVVEFISTGVLDVTPPFFLLHHEGSLRRQLGAAARDRSEQVPTPVSTGVRVYAHCHGVFVLPGSAQLCVAVSWNNVLSPVGWISYELKDEADALFFAHQAKVEEFEEAEARAEQKHEEFLETLRENEKHRDLASKLYGQSSRCLPPILTIEGLLRLLPRAVNFLLPPTADNDQIDLAAIAAITASGWSPSRDGVYSGLIPTTAGMKAEGLVSWVPHTGLPSYPEVRWAVQTGLPNALRKPRWTSVSPPRLVEETPSPMDAAQIDGSGLNPIDLKVALDGLHLDDDDQRQRVNDVRAGTKIEGFEAIAWFQAFHKWSEETWGIYIDARKLDDLALSYLDDFRSKCIQVSSDLAGFLAFGLIYAHEMFHACVEAALSMQELTARSPRYLRYNEKVYQALRETPAWLEEALANWSAWNWFKAPETQALIAQMSPNIDGVAWVVEASLDLSPPGYQDWRLGHHLGTWRIFANQLAFGKTSAGQTGFSPPLEGWLKGDPIYELLPSDIPLRFVGSGQIADKLLSQPGIFGVPARREIERALTYFRYSLDASAGKGSHQKWTGQDQRAFSLPMRDPVSRGVFHTFLNHVGIDKLTYVREVRPNL